jgi:hypothetical protein
LEGYFVDFSGVRDLSIIIFQKTRGLAAKFWIVV